MSGTAVEAIQSQEQGQEQGQGQGNWLTLSSAAFTAIVVGFASTILVVMEAARSVGATPLQQASWAASLCFAMGVTSLFLSAKHRIPIITAWSTPGAVLITSSHSGASFNEALGAFMVAGLLMALTALIKPLARAIARIPAPIAAAMLAGVLLHYCLQVPSAALAMPHYVLPLVVLFFVLRMLLPLYAVPIVVVVGAGLAVMSGQFDQRCCDVAVTRLLWERPEFSYLGCLSLSIPLFLVTMASQNLPGFAVLRSAGYEPPVSSCLLVTGLGSAAAAPFGGHAVNMAAITAAIVTGKEAYGDRTKRWKVSVPYCIIYVLVGLSAGLCVQILGAMPQPMITAVAGLALISPLMGGLTSMVSAPRDVESAVVTFLVAASGVSVFSIGSAFWGLVVGLVIFSARHIMQRKRHK